MTDEPEKATTIHVVPDPAPDPAAPPKTIKAIDALKELLEWKAVVEQRLAMFMTCIQCGNWVNPGHENVQGVPVKSPDGQDLVVFRCARCSHRNKIQVAEYIPSRYGG